MITLSTCRAFKTMQVIQIATTWRTEVKLERRRSIQCQVTPSAIAWSMCRTSMGTIWKTSRKSVMIIIMTGVHARAKMIRLKMTLCRKPSQTSIGGSIRGTSLGSVPNRARDLPTLKVGTSFPDQMTIQCNNWKRTRIQLW